MNDWEKVKIEDIATLIAGFAFKSKDFGDFNDKVVKIKDIIPPGVDIINAEGVDLTAYSKERLQKYIIGYGDYLLAMTGATIGKIGRSTSTKPAYINQRVLKFSPIEGKCDKKFLYYVLHNGDFLPYILNHIDSQSVQPNISASSVGGYQFALPTLNIQHKIVKILSSLDDKIELNAQINHNLEEQAKAIFKSWFVDFEPFQNCEFIDSELGKIPSGWKVYKLADFLPVITGKKNANVSSEKGEYPFFSCSQDFAWTDNYSFDGHAILVAGNGDFNVKWYNGKFEAYQRTYVLMPYNARYTSWLYYAVQYNLTNITSAARGSVIKFITKGNLENFAFAAPIDLDNFDIIDTFCSINQTIDCFTQENYRLSGVRDTLLPKLMSGEIDVSEVEV